MRKGQTAFLVLNFLLVMPVGAASPTEVQYPGKDGTLLKAWVFQPSAPAQAWPTVVALHGCGGLYATRGLRTGLLNARHQAMADRLVDAGYAVVFPDSLSPRGVRELCTQAMRERRITQRERRQDVLATLDWVRAQAWAAPERVALLGWSHGGSAVLAATDSTQPEVQAQAGRFATAIAFYPGCSAALKSGYRPNTSLSLLVGEKDDWTAPGPCVALGQQVGAQVEVYADSYHDFDNPEGQVRLRKDVPNGVHPGQGVHVGPNPVAREQANALVLARLKQAFR